MLYPYSALWLVRKGLTEQTWLAQTLHIPNKKAVFRNLSLFFACLQPWARLPQFDQVSCQTMVYRNTRALWEWAGV